jgi:Divergent InlB B-repeat domain/Beta-galactosidase
LILLFCLIAASAHAGTMKEAPKGMYIFSSGKLSATNQAVTSAGTAISNANCDGVRWKARWADIEAIPDTYTWQYLDDAVALAAANNKKCGISINAGGACPAWLFAAPYNAQSYTLQDSPGVIGLRIPVPGDPVFMTRWQKFITAFGARYDNNPAVSYVIICGIGTGDQWDIAPGTLDTAALGSTQAEVDTWKASSKQIIDFFMSAFPNTTVIGYPVPPFDPSNAAEDPATSMREVSDYAANNYNCHFGYSFAAFQSSTTTSNSVPANEVFLHWITNPTHGETLNTATSADDFDATLHVAVDLKIRGMEIYKLDFQNAGLQNFIVSSGPYIGEVGGITPRRADMLAIAAPTPCLTPTPTPTPTATPTATPTLTPSPTPTPVATVQVTVQTTPGGLAFSVDGTTYSSTQSFSWQAASSHTMATTSPQSGGTGIRYVWSNWSGGGAISRTVAPTTNKTYTAIFTKQYYLTMSHGTGGTVTPSNGWRTSGAVVSISATPISNSSVSYNFSDWTGSGTGSYSGSNNPASITMNGPITETASFTQNPVQVTVQTNTGGLSFSVDGTTYTAAQTFSWAPGSSHTIATTSPQNGDTGVRYVWGNWSGGSAISHTVTPAKNTTYTANFTKQYYLTMNHGTGGTVTPTSGWRSSGTTFSITATPATGYSFKNWSGSGTGSFSGTTNPVSITMDGPLNETAGFTKNP